jgi:hypothetical protein
MSQKFEVTIQWGFEASAQPPPTYSFNSQAELDAFMMGVEEAEGWSEYKIISTSGFEEFRTPQSRMKDDVQMDNEDDSFQCIDPECPDQAFAEYHDHPVILAHSTSDEELTFNTPESLPVPTSESEALIGPIVINEEIKKASIATAILHAENERLRGVPVVVGIDLGSEPDRCVVCIEDGSTPTPETES